MEQSKINLKICLENKQESIRLLKFQQLNLINEQIHIMEASVFSSLVRTIWQLWVVAQHDR